MHQLQALCIGHLINTTCTLYLLLVLVLVLYYISSKLGKTPNVNKFENNYRRTRMGVESDGSLGITKALFVDMPVRINSHAQYQIASDLEISAANHIKIQALKDKLLKDVHLVQSLHHFQQSAWFNPLRLNLPHMQHLFKVELPILIKIFVDIFICIHKLKRCLK